MDGLLLAMAKAYAKDLHVLSARPWTCNKKKNGHALGLLIEVVMDGYVCENLLLFRNAVKVEFIKSEAQIMNRNEGTAHCIECSLCAERRTFWIGKKLIRRLVQTYEAE